MDVIESLIAKLGLDVSEFKEGMVKSGEAVHHLNETMETLQQGLAAAAIGEFIHKQLESAAATVHFADNVGITTEKLQAFTFAAQEHSVKAAEAERVWTTFKKKLDELRAGLPGAIEDFEKLGLSAADYKNAGLAEALQITAKAFVENEAHAGSYAAFQELVGTKSRNLTSTLKELGEDGWAPMEAHAEHAHAIIGDKTLRDLEEVNKSWEKQFNLLKTGGAVVVGFITNFVQSIATLGGAHEMLVESFLKGGPFSESGRGAIKATLQAMVTQIHDIWAGTEGAGESAKKHGEAVKETLPPLTETKALTEARAKYEAEVAKAARESASTAAQIASVEAEIVAHKAKAEAATNNAVKAQQELTEVVKLEGDLRKLNAKLIEDTLKNTLSWIDQERAMLPIQEQEAAIEEKMAATMLAINDLNAKHLDSTKLRAQYDALDLELWQQRHKVAEDFVKTAGELLSNDVQRVAAAKVHLEILQGHLTTAGALVEFNVLLAKGVQNLSDAEKGRLAGLAAELTAEEKQVEITSILVKGAENLTAQDKERLAVLTGQLKTITEIKNQMQAMISLGAAKAAGGIRTYYDPIEQAEYERQLVESAQQQIAQDMSAVQEQINVLRKSGSSFGAFQIPALVQQLAALSYRQQHVRDYVFNPNYSDARGMGIFAEQVSSIGDPLQIQKKVTDALTSIGLGVGDLNQRLLTAGFPKTA